MDAIKCVPPKSPYHKKDFSVCTERNAFDPLFMENVKDIADTMAEIMIVCGIHRCKAKAARSIVVKAFQFYDIKRHRFEVADNASGFCRDHIVGDFERKCLMTRIEALLAYCIVKRAVKAFYHGTPDHSIRNPITEAMVLKEQQYIWLHAARRTIALFERYEHMFFNAQCNCATQILSIYKELHGRLTNRADPIIVEDNHPRGCVKKMIIGTRSPPKLPGDNSKCVKKCRQSQDLREYIENLPPKGFPMKTCLTLPSTCPLMGQNKPQIREPPNSLDGPPLKKKKKEVKNPDLNLSRCAQCNCPQLICDCDINRDTGVVAIDCSQGAFECQWVRMDGRGIDKPELHQCTVDCCTSEICSASNATGYSDCSAESSNGYDYSEDGSELEMKEEKDFETAGSEETLPIPMYFNRKSSFTACQSREISKLPVPKCKRPSAMKVEIIKKK